MFVRKKTKLNSISGKEGHKLQFLGINCSIIAENTAIKALSFLVHEGILTSMQCEEISHT
ncbi:MAG: hypothetical protein L5655_10760 [Thermosediminibacteraceae bacterium]|nr:hypothetical protein [Thermosediminibacteraceae bacterium]